ncbi:MAG: hypothetical protein IJA36_08230, partial [Lachnospiraceae bacterium]|nr:hypothetical protein [Lachnospiraceae bacterium]
QETGYKNVYTPLVKAVWYGKNPAGVISHEDEEFFRENYEHILTREDPYYSQSCETEKCEYGLRRKK